MLGWQIFIHQNLPGETPDTPNREVLLGSWMVGLSGLDWLDKLVSEGRATDLGGTGYPDRYSISAAELRAAISNGPPQPKGPDVIGDDYFTPGDWVGETKIDYDKLANCADDEQLSVEAWDQS